MPLRLSVHLPTWTELNHKLRGLHTERAVQELYEQLVKAGANHRWLRRTHARLRQLRARRERLEFERGLRAYKGPRPPKNGNRK